MKMMKNLMTRTRYKRYEHYCPDPVKDKTELPVYWNKLNKWEQVRWHNENMVTDDYVK